MTKDCKDSMESASYLEALEFGNSISIIHIPYRDFYSAPRKLPREHTETFCGMIYLGQPDEILKS